MLAFIAAVGIFQGAVVGGAFAGLMLGAVFSRATARGMRHGVSTLCPARGPGSSNVPKGSMPGRVASHVVWAGLLLATLAWTTSSLITNFSWLFGGLVGGLGLVVGIAAQFLRDDPS